MKSELLAALVSVCTGTILVTVLMSTVGQERTLDVLFVGFLLSGVVGWVLLAVIVFKLFGLRRTGR